jgi:hypothetical protein
MFIGPPTTQPYGLYDSTTPSSLPSDKPNAVYADGAYAADPSQVPGHDRLWIDVNTSDPHANALDVEPGDATPSQAGAWVAAHDAEESQPAIVYTMMSDWSSVQQAVREDAPGKPCQYWIADPTGVPHLVPGSSATQWYWGSSVDISETTPGFGQGSTHGTDHRTREHALAAAPRHRTTSTLSVLDKDLASAVSVDVTRSVRGAGRT